MVFLHLGMVSYDPDDMFTIFSTPAGQIMARSYMKFSTMEGITSFLSPADELMPTMSMQALLALLSNAEELAHQPKKVEKVSI